MLSSRSLLIFVHCFFLPLSTGSYIVDDADGTIRYSTIVWKLESTNNTYTSAAGCTPIDQQPINRSLTDASLGGIVGGVLAFFLLVFAILSFWMRSVLQKREEKDGPKLPLHGCSVGSQSPTLVQSSHPVSLPPSFPTAAFSQSPTLLPGNGFHSSSASPLPPTPPPPPSQSSHLTKIPDQQAQQPERNFSINIDARSSGSKVVFDIASRH